MAHESPSRPQGTSSLLAEARREVADSGELIKLVLAGVHQVDAWLIENRILPLLDRDLARRLVFTLGGAPGADKSVTLIPLPDGSAFARSTSGKWFALDQAEATSAIEHIGFRYAPQDRWQTDFHARLEAPGEAPVPIGPFEVASIWEEIAGARPAGFESGTLDEVEAFGLKLIDMFFDTQGQLGL